jgi:uroporphyrinogen-III synthase
MTLYLGLDPSSYPQKTKLIHYPIIKIIPQIIPKKIWDTFSAYTHIIFTSKTTVNIFLQQFPQKPEKVREKTVIAIGKATASSLIENSIFPKLVPSDETQEGIIQLLEGEPLTNAFIFYPRSSLARKSLEVFFRKKKILYHPFELYHTKHQKITPTPDFSLIEEIVFTSPSTVRGFFTIFNFFPYEKKLTCIGPITKKELQKWKNWYTSS